MVEAVVVGISQQMQDQAELVRKERVLSRIEGVLKEWTTGDLRIYIEFILCDLLLMHSQDHVTEALERWQKRTSSDGKPFASSNGELNAFYERALNRLPTYQRAVEKGVIIPNIDWYIDK